MCHSDLSPREFTGTGPLAGAPVLLSSPPLKGRERPSVETLWLVPAAAATRHQRTDLRPQRTTE